MVENGTELAVRMRICYNFEGELRNQSDVPRGISLGRNMCNIPGIGISIQFVMFRNIRDTTQPVKVDFDYRKILRAAYDLRNLCQNVVMFVLNMYKIKVPNQVGEHVKKFTVRTRPDSFRTNDARGARCPPRHWDLDVQCHLTPVQTLVGEIACEFPRETCGETCPDVGIAAVWTKQFPVVNLKTI